MRTRTDSDGVAQVQWTVGTHLELPTQRVEARLLDLANQRTPQTALFVAQLAIAQETAWNPLVAWLSARLTSANWDVQAAIDAIAIRLDAVANGTHAFDPFLGIQWRNTSNVLQTLDATANVPLAHLIGGAKRDKDLMARLEARVRRDYPEQGERCVRWTAIVARGEPFVHMPLTHRRPAGPRGG